MEISMLVLRIISSYYMISIFYVEPSDISDNLLNKFSHVISPSSVSSLSGCMSLLARNEVCRSGMEPCWEFWFFSHGSLGPLKWSHKTQKTYCPKDLLLSAMSKLPRYLHPIPPRSFVLLETEKISPRLDNSLSPFYF